MNRTRATILLIAVSLASLGATGCHRHRNARGVYPVMAYQPMMAAPQPIVIVVETRTGGAPEVNYAQEAAEQEAAGRAEAARQARIEQERAARARIEQERAERARIAQERAERAARARQEQADRDAQARAAAQGQTTIIVLSPGARPVQVDGWFQGQ